MAGLQTDLRAFFAAERPGALLWSSKRPPILLAFVPGRPRAELVRLYCCHAEKNWAAPGPVCDWDGSWTEPTLRKSIVAPRCGWHGWIRAGRIETCADSPIR